MGRKAECDCYLCRADRWRKRAYYYRQIGQLFFEPRPEYIKVKNCQCNNCIQYRERSKRRWQRKKALKPPKPVVLKKYDRLDMIALDDPEIRRGRI